MNSTGRKEEKHSWADRKVEKGCSSTEALSRPLGELGVRITLQSWGKVVGLLHPCID